jgi:Ca-activated chloride channel family protein
VQREGDKFVVRLGDLMTDAERVILANLISGQLHRGVKRSLNLQVRYDDPGVGAEGLLSEVVSVEADVQGVYQPLSILRCKSLFWLWRSIGKLKLQRPNCKRAIAPVRQRCCKRRQKTALQMGDQSAATVLQTSATRLQAGEELSKPIARKTRIVSKTILQE